MLDPTRCLKLTGCRNYETVWVDRDTLSAVVRLVDTYQVVSQLEHVVSQATTNSH